ncbi:hypothetical protein VTK73DRAFT_6704 [Phialemonium thermophilum]|uniref:Uncharacterized protein n=1 Tax=Phialemonium thermophilum TaxID=223376 RepID=A0ABR3XW94_9PEZI
MRPPPATPAPSSSSRFLLSKQQQSRQRNESPSQPAADGMSQFHATPRFATSSASRLPVPFGTPLGSVAKPRLPGNRTTVRDDIDSSPPGSPESVVLSSPGLRVRSTTHGIEIASSVGSPSQSPVRDDKPTPKRRRISPSPEIEETDLPPLTELGRVSVPHHHRLRLSKPLESSLEDVDTLETSSGTSPGSPRGHPTVLQGVVSSSPSLGNDSESENDTLQVPTPRHKPHHHPVFHRAPRFKVIDADTQAADHLSSHQYPLPEAFSPQRRRGTKYVPGGLAAELRDWLVAVKGDVDASAVIGGGDEAPSADGGAAGIVEVVFDVDEARPGPGMWLVRGRQRPRENGADEEAVEVRAILAGEGRSSGLARRNIVSRGSIVQTWPPSWDIDLGSDRWSIVCDWAVLEEND